MSKSNDDYLKALDKLHGLIKFKPLKSDYFGDEGPTFLGHTTDEILDDMERRGCWFGEGGREKMRLLIEQERKNP